MEHPESSSSSCSSRYRPRSSRISGGQSSPRLRQAATSAEGSSLNAITTGRGYHQGSGSGPGGGSHDRSWQLDLTPYGKFKIPLDTDVLKQIHHRARGMALTADVMGRLSADEVSQLIGIILEPESKEQPFGLLELYAYMLTDLRMPHQVLREAFELYKKRKYPTADTPEQEKQQPVQSEHDLSFLTIEVAPKSLNKVARDMGAKGIDLDALEDCNAEECEELTRPYIETRPPQTINGEKLKSLYFYLHQGRNKSEEYIAAMDAHRERKINLTDQRWKEIYSQFPQRLTVSESSRQAEHWIGSTGNFPILESTPLEDDEQLHRSHSTPDNALRQGRSTADRSPFGEQYPAQTSPNLPGTAGYLDTSALETYGYSYPYANVQASNVQYERGPSSSRQPRHANVGPYEHAHYAQNDDLSMVVAQQHRDEVATQQARPTRDVDPGFFPPSSYAYWPQPEQLDPAVEDAYTKHQKFYHRPGDTFGRATGSPYENKLPALPASANDADQTFLHYYVDGFQPPFGGQQGGESGTGSGSSHGGSSSTWHWNRWE